MKKYNELVNLAIVEQENITDLICDEIQLSDNDVYKSFLETIVRYCNSHDRIDLLHEVLISMYKDEFFEK